MTTTTKKAPAAKQELQAIEPKSRTRIPRREWVVIRRCLRTRRQKTIGTFDSPSYAVIFRNALGGINPSAELIFSIQEQTRHE